MHRVPAFAKGGQYLLTGAEVEHLLETTQEYSFLAYPLDAYVRNKKAPHRLAILPNPSILVDIGTYFGKPANIWFPWSGQNSSAQTDKRAAWLGCNDNDFNLNANSNLDDDDARGVHGI